MTVCRLRFQRTVTINVNAVNDAPVFTSDPITGTGATEELAYTGTLNGSASDIDALDTLTYSKVSGPAWLQVASNGALSGTPANSDVGSNAFTVRVTDASGATDEAVLTIEVANVNDAPTFATDPTIGTGATEDTAYTGTLAGTASDIDAGDTLTYSKVDGPAWLQVASNGALSGTPGNSDVGSNAFTVRVTDAPGHRRRAAHHRRDQRQRRADLRRRSDHRHRSHRRRRLQRHARRNRHRHRCAGHADLLESDRPGLAASRQQRHAVRHARQLRRRLNAFTVRVTDAALAPPTQQLTIEVANVNDAPTFAADPTIGTGATEDIAYIGTLAGTASDIDALTL